MFIVENGLGAVDTPNEAGEIEDDYRIDYLAAQHQRGGMPSMKMVLSSGVIRLGAVLTWSLPGLEK